MEPLSRDLLLRRVQLLHDQYSEQLRNANDRPAVIKRWNAAARRLRAHASEADADFVDFHLHCVMVNLGLIPKGRAGCPASPSTPRTRLRLVPASS